ncbi:antitoxin [Mycolicibacterium sp. 120266]|uniref:antitoxin n=1 Tax=Mycolicibacterium sp. 120266 TaxID=3090601 RepID=UPI00299DBB0A|nr:antitoxin [Mycolicibacterium sp. 120266]MDX1870833.1 antitoxin [Mycolicibacterium sp. 120266]
MSFLDKAKNLIAENADKVDAAIDKVGDIVDEKTGDKYQGIVDKAQEAAKNAARNIDPNTSA